MESPTRRPWDVFEIAERKDGFPLPWKPALGLVSCHRCVLRTGVLDPERYNSDPGLLGTQSTVEDVEAPGCIDHTGKQAAAG